MSYQFDPLTHTQNIPGWLAKKLRNIQSRPRPKARHRTAILY
jgi:hypothetical protein